MVEILRLRPVRVLLLLLVTLKFPFAVADSIAPLKLQEYGVKKEHMAYIASGMMPAPCRNLTLPRSFQVTIVPARVQVTLALRKVYIMLPAVVSRWTTNSTPWDLLLQTYPWRVLLVGHPEHG